MKKVKKVRIEAGIKLLYLSSKQYLWLKAFLLDLYKEGYSFCNPLVASLIDADIASGIHTVEDRSVVFALNLLFGLNDA